MMRLPRFEVLFPATVEEACTLLDKHGPQGRVMAGGTDIIPAAKLGNIEPTCLISLKGIHGLKGITYQEKEGLTIGAMTPLVLLRQDAFIRGHYQALAQAASVVGSPQIQRMGTLGGNLCLDTRCYFYNQSSSWRQHRPVCFKMGSDVCHVVPKGKRCHAAFSADTPSALIALNAKVRLVSSKGTRLISVGDLYTGDGKEPMALRPGEVLTEIQLPPMTHQVSVYLKYRIRKAIDFPLVGVAVQIARNGREDGCDRAKIVLTAVGPGPVEVFEAEALLNQASLSQEVIKKAAEMAIHVAHPVPNIGSTPTYRRKMVGILTQKALSQLAKEMAFGGGKGVG
jgi:4-hydroxybenzoyl-CoA reductase subunit beta